MKKRILILALCLIMTLTSACSSSPSDTTTSGSPSDPVSITIFGLPVTVPDTDPIIPELEKRLGIDINIESTGGDESVLVARLAGGNIPDVFRVTTINNLSSYYQNGVLLDLSKYMDKMPNVKKMFTEQQWARVTFNGGIYGIPRRPEANYNCWYIRHDWLEKLGLKDPETFDDLLNVAIAMKDADLDGNGKNDTYPISGTYGSWAKAAGRDAFQGFFTAYGVTGPETIMIRDNKAVMAVTLPESRLAIEEIRRFVDAGVVEPEIISNTWGVLREKMATGKVGICFGGWANFSKPAEAKTLKAVDPNANWAPFKKQIKTKYGESGASDSASGNDAVYAINADLAKDPKKLDAILNMFNYMATEECDRLLSFGIEGVHYNIDQEGKVVKLDKMDELTYGWGIQFLGRDDMVYCMTKFANCAEYIKYCAEDITVLKHYGQMVEQPEGYNVSDIEAYVMEQIAQFIYGTRSMSEWDSFISTLYNSYSLDRYLKAANESLIKLGYIK